MYIYIHAPQVGTCLTLYGSEWLQTKTSFNFPGFTTGISVSVWFKFTGLSTDNYVRIFDFGNAAGVDDMLLS
jgi:hypothetical protein